MPLLDAYGREIQPHNRDAQEREDAWANQATGLGVWGQDKTKAATYLPVWRVMDQELTSLMNGSDIARKIVSARPEEMFRRGFEISAPNVNETERKALRKFATEHLDLENNLLENKRWGRLYGGSLLVMGIDDGRNPWEPLDENNIRSFDSLSLVDRRYSYVQSQYAAMGTTSKYGKAQVYLISNAVAGYGWDQFAAQKIDPRPVDDLVRQGAQVVLVHESRVIRADGNPADVVTRQNLAGWSWSVLQVVYDAMKQFDGSFDAAAYLLSDASQGVFKLQGLLKAISSGQRANFSMRLQLLEQTRSVMHGIALDAGGADGKNAESFERTPTPFGGIPELLDKMMLRMASAADMPVTKLFGRAPAGMNATGESDTRQWYDTIANEQENDLTPQVKRILRLLGLAKKGPLRGRDCDFTIKWRPLWSPTDKEVADTRLSKAQTDQIYIQNGVVKPEEVALDLTDQYPNLDIEGREESLEKGLIFNPYENQPSPQTSTLIAAKGEGEPLSSKAPVTLTGTSGTQTTKGALPAVAAVEQLTAAGHGAQPPAAKPVGKPSHETPMTRGAEKDAEKDKTKKDAAIPIADLPADFGTAVPLRGSSCSDCRFLHMVPGALKDGVAMPTCHNETFSEWQSRRQGYWPEEGEGVRIPATGNDPRRYCCSAWQAAPGVLDAVDEALRITARNMLQLRKDRHEAMCVFEALLEDFRAVLRQDADGEAKRVYQQLAEDYPTRLLGWVLSAHWKGPVEVPTNEVDSSSREEWTASHDGKLEDFKSKIAEGVRKPAILVKVPDNDKYIIVDGHHRFLGHEALGLPLLAYVAEVHVSRGPWDSLHDAQKGGRSGPSFQGPSWRKAHAPGAKE